MSTMKLGIGAKWYYRSTGNYASPTWSEISLANALELGNQWDTVDAPDRSTRVKGYAKTMLDIGFTASVKKKDNSNALTAILDAFNSPTANMDVLVLDGPKDVNNSRGYRFDAIITKASEDQGTGVAIYVDTEFKPDGFSDNPPSSALVTSGSPVFTAL